MTSDSQVKNKNKEDQISVKEFILKCQTYYQYLVSKWIIILLFSILGGIFGFLYAKSKKPVYTASTTFVLESGESGSGGLSQYASLASMAGIDLGGGGGIFQGDNLLELYKSRTMIEKTLLSFVNGYPNQLLIDRYIELNKLRNKWADNQQLSGIQFKPTSGLQVLKMTRLQDSVIGKIVEDINKNYLLVSKPDKKLNIIRVDVKAADEVFAKDFNNQIVQNVNDFYKQTKTKKSLDNIKILQHKTDSVRMVMNGAIYSAIAVADATPNLNPTKQVQRVAPAQRAQFSAETNKAVLGELVKNLEMSKMAVLKETPLIQVVDEPVYPLSMSRLGRATGAIGGAILFGILVILCLSFRKIAKSLIA